jgi:hypothetical protein
MPRSVNQAGGMKRGGWKTASDWRVGWISFVSAKKRESPIKAKPGSDAHQAQESRRPSTNPGGIAGAAGCPEHNAPEQGRDGTGTGIPSDFPARSWIKGSISDESRSESVRDVTRWEQPASVPGGASKPKARSNTTAPAGRETSCLREEDFVIRWVWLNRPPSFSGGMARNRGDEAIDDQNPLRGYTRRQSIASTLSFFGDSHHIAGSECCRREFAGVIGGNSCWITCCPSPSRLSMPSRTIRQERSVRASRRTDPKAERGG